MIVTVYAECEGCPRARWVCDVLDSLGYDYELYHPFPMLLERMVHSNRWLPFPHIFLERDFIGSCEEFAEILDFLPVSPGGPLHVDERAPLPDHEPALA